MRLPLILVFTVCLPAALLAQTPAKNFLAGNTVLIIRHSEKPETGRGLTPAGEARARAYISYFEPFHEAGLKFRVDALFAGADSDSSDRPRLTLEPISRATGLKLDTSIPTEDPDKLVASLRTHPHGTHPLIAWRHRQMAELVHAFGASASLIPGSRWPDEVYDWVIVLRFDRNGVLEKQERIVENLPMPQVAAAPVARP